MTFLNGAMQVLGGIATIYTLGTNDAKVKQSGVVTVNPEEAGLSWSFSSNLDCKCILV